MRFGWLLLVVFAGRLFFFHFGEQASQSGAGRPSRRTLWPPIRITRSAKYLELVGLRIRERSKGHLIVQFGIVNHSEADVGDVKMTVNLTTTAAKPSDPPLITFDADVPHLGPSELTRCERGGSHQDARL